MCHMWGSESREVLSHTPTPCCLDHTGDLKRTSPHPAPNSWDHPGPSTCSLHHPVLSMRSECGWPSCGAWPPCWRPLHLLMWVLMWPVQNILMCFSCSLSPHALSVLSFTHPSVCLRISSAEWALWAAWHARAWACPLRNAYNIGVFLTAPNTAVSFAVFPPHQFQTKSLLDTKNNEVSLKPDLEPKSMCPSMSGTSGAHQLMPNRFQNLQLGQRCHHCSCPSLSSWLLFPNLELFSFHHIHSLGPFTAWIVLGWSQLLGEVIDKEYEKYISFSSWQRGSRAHLATNYPAQPYLPFLSSNCDSTWIVPHFITWCRLSQLRDPGQ